MCHAWYVTCSYPYFRIKDALNTNVSNITLFNNFSHYWLIPRRKKKLFYGIPSQPWRCQDLSYFISLQKKHFCTWLVYWIVLTSPSRSNDMYLIQKHMHTIQFEACKEVPFLCFHFLLLFSEHENPCKKKKKNYFPRYLSHQSTRKTANAT